MLRRTDVIGHDTSQDTSTTSALPLESLDYSTMTPDEIYAAKTRVTHEELVAQLQSAQQDATGSGGVTTSALCSFAANGDDVHTSVYSGVNYASGHGWWINVNCPSTYRANVTVWLEEKLGGTWYPQGDPGYGANRLPGKGSATRVTAKMACVDFSSHVWRSVVAADIVGHSDTAPTAVTPAWTLACY